MSKTIGNMTLKAAPVGTDMVAIADSEDLDRTKKVLLSALSGGGASNVHLVDNITNTYVSDGIIFNGTSSDVTQYEHEHLYIFKSTADSDTHKYLNINSLGNVEIFYNYRQYMKGSSYYPNRVFPTGLVLVVYNLDQNTPSNTGFYLLDTIDSSAKEYGFFNYLLCGKYSVCANDSSTNRMATIRQYESTLSGATVSIDFTANYGFYKHGVITCSTPLTSLTLTKLTDGNGSELVWEKEIHFTTDATFTFTATDLVGKWLGVSAPTFEANTSYVIAIKNGYATYAKVGA